VWRITINGITMLVEENVMVSTFIDKEGRTNVVLDKGRDSLGIVLAPDQTATVVSPEMNLVEPTPCPRGDA